MQRERIQKTLYREFTRSPAKTAALIALLPVAIYFIGPLITGTGKNAKPKLLASAVKLPDETPAGTVSTAPASTAHDNWQMVVQKIESDPFRSPGVLRTARNPFAFAAPADNEPLVAADDEVESSLEVEREAPNEMHLTGTVIGQQLRLATISGRTYGLLDVILDEDGAPTAMPPWVVSQIGRKHVVVERGRTAHRLQLKEQRLADGFRIVRPAYPASGRSS